MGPFVVHAQTSIPWQKRYLEAILEGLKRNGHSATYESGQSTGPGTHIVLGPNCFKECFASLRRQGRNVITINRAFIGDVLGHQDDPFVAIGWNGYNNHAGFPFHYGDELPYSRATKTFWKSIKPAKGRTGPVLILGEFDTPQSYIRQAIEDCQKLDLPYWYRPHPSASNTPHRVRMCPIERLSTACDESILAMSHHSTAACEALLRGLPVIAYDSESMCWPVCTQGPLGPASSPFSLPDRTRWVEWLAWTQWTISEIRKGEPWPWVLDYDSNRRDEADTS